MSRILGVACDNCGKTDIEVNSNGFTEDRFPRNGWLSLNQWEDEGVAGEELHLCSVQCLTKFSQKVEEQPEDHVHDE